MNHSPKVSICLPNLNTRPFLSERLETIFDQTLQDWELIVCDNHSEDGAWEFFQEQAGLDKRIRISQAPREGLYANWNNCIRQARGQYVYIATSDDTMMPDCLEKMVEALEANPDCGLCQCALVIIDEKGIPYPPERQWNHYTLGTYDLNLVTKKNKRLAPHDGLLFPALFTIYTSITQLLIRRKVFDRVGLFDGTWGSISDFEWGMRASLVENCIFIPEKLATWRLHPHQATQEVHTPKVRLKMIEMAKAAFAQAQSCERIGLHKIDIDEVVYFLERDLVELIVQTAKNKRQHLRFLLEQFTQRPRPVVDYVLARFQKKPWGFWNCFDRYDRLRRLLKKYQVPSPLFE